MRYQEMAYQKIEGRALRTSEGNVGLVFLLKMFLQHFHLHTHTLKLCKSDLTL